MIGLFKYFLSKNSTNQSLSLSTFRPLKKNEFYPSLQSNDGSNTLDNKITELLTPENLLIAVSIPEGLFKEEFLKFNIVEFYNDISLIWGTISKDIKAQEIGDGFPE